MKHYCRSAWHTPHGEWNTGADLYGSCTINSMVHAGQVQSAWGAMPAHRPMPCDLPQTQSSNMQSGTDATSKPPTVSYQACADPAALAHLHLHTVTCLKVWDRDMTAANQPGAPLSRPAPDPALVCTLPPVLNICCGWHVYHELSAALSSP
mmetsp:Transcript_2687/g.5939  ORF Transcript_2687/g.5939 Transcript_2687/m.5939 type:complete len:151 (+) Transcript_2687:158-610(+)